MVDFFPWQSKAKFSFKKIPGKAVVSTSESNDFILNINKKDDPSRVIKREWTFIFIFRNKSIYP